MQTNSKHTFFTVSKYLNTCLLSGSKTLECWNALTGEAWFCSSPIPISEKTKCFSYLLEKKKKKPSRFLEIQTKGVFSGLRLGERVTEVMLLIIAYCCKCHYQHWTLRLLNLIQLLGFFLKYSLVSMLTLLKNFGFFFSLKLFHCYTFLCKFCGTFSLGYRHLCS